MGTWYRKVGVKAPDAAPLGLPRPQTRGDILFNPTIPQRDARDAEAFDFHRAAHTRNGHLPGRDYGARVFSRGDDEKAKYLNYCMEERGIPRATEPTIQAADLQGNPKFAGGRPWEGPPAHWTNTSPPECMSGLFRTLIERSHSATVRWNRSDNESQSPCDNSLTSVFPIVRSRHRAYEPVITMRHILWYRDVHRRPHHRRMEARPSIGQGKDRWVACSILDQQLFATRYESTGLSFEDYAGLSLIPDQVSFGSGCLPLTSLPSPCLVSFRDSGQPDHVWTPGETQTPCEWTENHELKQTNSFVNRGHGTHSCMDPAGLSAIGPCRQRGDAPADAPRHYFWVVFSLHVNTDLRREPGRTIERRDPSSSASDDANLQPGQA
ncbi:hypothetical protein CIHG_00035 [Coccidioides immitis H538.4]|uniref:Uncharacterized protein n=1 Tax=Coccidioides immitis H538.4 TaxID=396776 RepID=A0A0J8RE82_COCIT|nr:hypothetical protein CIHG_00035 [Coccidioides immitis H538.4]